MSRVIENDHPWTDDEIAYHLDRGRTYEVEQNRLQFPKGTESPAVQAESAPKLNLAPEIFEHVNSLDVSGLQSELSQNGLETRGDEKELKVRLAAFLQKQKDDERNA